MALTPIRFPTPLSGLRGHSLLGPLIQWLDDLVRVLQDAWTKLVPLINGVDQRITTVETSVSALQARAKDIYTFTVPGTLSAGVKVTLPLLARVAGTLVEAFANVETSPGGANLDIDLNRNGVSIFPSEAGRLIIPPGSTTAVQTSFAVSAVAVGDKFTLDLDQVGTTPARDLTIHLVCR